MIDQVGTAAISVLVGLAVGYFFTRWNRDYVTAGQCGDCQKDQQMADDSFKREVRERLGIISGALVVLAAGKEISLEDIQRILTSGVPR